jgi:hypothetical protein
VLEGGYDPATLALCVTETILGFEESKDVDRADDAAIPPRQQAILDDLDSPSEAKFIASSPAFSSNAMKTPGSPNCTAPRTMNSIASNVLPQPASPHRSVGRPCGKATAGQLVQPRYSGRRFSQGVTWFLSRSRPRSSHLG